MAGDVRGDAAGDVGGAPPPVFYDRTGKRWQRVQLGVAALFLSGMGLVVWLVPQMFSPVWSVPQNQGSDYPRQLLESSDIRKLPVLGAEGEGALARIVLVRRSHGQVQLVDPFYDQVIRQATPDEANEIGGHDYALEWFSRPADRQLILTFDDGPDPRYTPTILDILSREHVQATFFVVGREVLKHPELVRRMIREGHMVGNHTFSHVGFGNGSARDRTEMIAADRILRTDANYSTRLFRIPGGDPDGNALTVLTAQQLGYINVDFTLDPKDWTYKPGQTIPTPKLDGRGHVVLLHDGGGDRTPTIRMLRELIAEAKAEGYTFATAGSLLSQDDLPVRDVEPSLADSAMRHGLWCLTILPGRLLHWVLWFSGGSLILMSVLNIVLALVSHVRQRRRAWPVALSRLPTASVVLPAYNEEKVIERTLSALVDSDYPNFEVIVVDDGSSDDTWQVLTAFAGAWPRLRIFRQPTNRGKAAALNRGVAEAKGEIIVTIDSDTILEPQVVGKLARHFSDPGVGAVSGYVKVGNRRNVLTAWQSLEYISGICVGRMAEGLIGAITIAPGACSAWRRRAILEAGGYPSDTQAEDCDLTLAIHRLRRYRVVHDNEAVAWTEAPMTISTLAKQRLRWIFGNLQAFHKHRHMILRPRYGALGMLVLPHALLAVLVPLVFMPLVYVTMMLHLSAGNWRGVALFAAFVAGVHLVISVVALVIAREPLWHLLVVPIYRLIYEPLRAYLLYASLLRVARGRIVGWYRPERTNTVTGAASRRVHSLSSE